MARTFTTMSAYSSSEWRGSTLTVEMPGRTGRTTGPEGRPPSMGATRSRASTSATRTRLPRRAASMARAAETVDLPTPPLPVTTTRRRSSKSEPDTTLDKLTSRGGEVHMLRSFLDHPLLRQARAAGEKQMGRMLSPEVAGAALQTLLAAAGEARERIDRIRRAALDAAQVPSSHDLDELKRRLVEMEELLDGLAARLARAEAREGEEGQGGGEGQDPGPARPGSGEG